MAKVIYWASRDSNDPSIWRDEDRAMAHASIVSNEPSIGKAKAALRDYMLAEAASIEERYGPNAFFNVNRGKINDPDKGAAKRSKALRAAAKQIARAKFSGEKEREAINFDADKLRFKLVRVAR